MKQATRYWMDDNGSVFCEGHAGSYLTAAIKHSPKAKQHRTPLGTFDLMTDEEAEEFLVMLQAAQVRHHEICEFCAWEKERATR